MNFVVVIKVVVGKSVVSQLIFMLTLTRHRINPTPYKLLITVVTCLLLYHITEDK